MQLITNGNLASASHVFLGAQNTTTKRAFTQYVKTNTSIDSQNVIIPDVLNKNNYDKHTYKSIQNQKHATIKQYWLLW